MISASWVVRVKDTQSVLFETYNTQVVERLNTVKYEAVPILIYLGELNAKIRNQ